MNAPLAHEPPKPAPAVPPRAFTPLARPVLQRHAASAAAPASAPASVHRTLDSPGRPLDADTRGFMESRFGHDFGHVRIHTDSRAADSARDVNAHAYTVGDHIAFAPGRYQPESHGGRQLLAHELAHTIQQGGLQRAARDGIATDRSPEYARLEREAEAAARAVQSGGHVGSLGRASSPILSRAGTGAPPPPPAAAPKGTVSLTTTAGALGSLSHDVWPDGTITAATKKARLRKFRVNTFYLPGAKGEGAEDIYKEYAGAKQLRAVIGFNAEGQPKSELWESRDRTAVLGNSWVQQVGWPTDEKDKRWTDITGQPFPVVNAGEAAAQFDHIVELQLGGTNNPSNLRPLDAKPNGESGTTIWVEVSQLAKAVRDEATFAIDPVTDQIELGFDSVVPKGPVWPGTPAAKPWNALKVHFKAMSERVAPAADATTKYIDLAAGVNRDSFAVPADWGTRTKKATLGDFPFNAGPSQLISSMALRTVTYINASVVTVGAELDIRNRTRIPLGTKAGADPASPPKFTLTGTKQAKGPYDLKLTAKPPQVEFDYPYLSRVRMKDITMNPAGDLDWKATVTPSVAFLPEVQVEYSLGNLKLVAGFDEAAFQKKKLLGFRITKAPTLKLTLAPAFNIEAEVGFGMGDPQKPIIDGSLKVTKDDIGPVATGQLKFNIPKVKEASSILTYKGGGGRNEWGLKLHLESKDFTLPGGYTLTGQLDASVGNDGVLLFAGKLAATLPGGNTASLGLQRRGVDDWVLTGEGRFKVPRIDAVGVTATYSLKTGALTASARTETGISFKIGPVDLTGKISKLAIYVSPEGAISVSEASGGLDFKTKKASGHVNLTIKWGKFSGDGTATYQLTEKLTVTAKIKYEEGKLRFDGSLTIAEIKLFDKKEATKEIFSFKIPIPIPGLSIGKAGLIANVRGALNAGYYFGPGLIAPVTLSAGFSPLEEDPNVELTVDGKLSIPAAAWISASISGGIALEIDALIVSAGVEAGIKLTGRAELGGELFATLSATYKEKKLKASMTAGLTAGLTIGASLDAYVLAYAKFLGFGADTRYDYNLGLWKWPTGLNFKLSAPFGYDSDTGPTFPDTKNIEVIAPQIDASSLFGAFFGKSNKKTTEL